MQRCSVQPQCSPRLSITTLSLVSALDIGLQTALENLSLSCVNATYNYFELGGNMRVAFVEQWRADLLVAFVDEWQADALVAVVPEWQADTLVCVVPAWQADALVTIVPEWRLGF